MTSRTLRLSDGSSVRVIKAGEGSPVLLIHGVGLRAEAWGPQIDALSTTHRVIAVDMPGHGESDALTGEPALPDYVAWAAKVVEAIGGPVAVAGHSMGALIAGGLAVERPDLVTRVTLLNGVFRRDAAAKAAVLQRAADLNGGLGDVEAPLARWFDAHETDVRDRVAAWLRTVPPAGYAAAYRAFAGGDDTYADRLNTIRCPFLALTADGDGNSTPAMSQAMAALARGKAQVITGHRHMVNLTAPDAVTSALRDWLKQEPAMSFDPRELRDAFGCFLTGVTVVTTTDENGTPLGFTANSFSSVSMDPPLLLVSIANTSGNLAHFTSGKGFAVNILSEHQKDVSATFARRSDDRFASVYWRRGPVGSPLIAEVSAWFDCTLEQAVVAGDHTILIGRIGAFESTKHPGLGYYRGAYVTPAATAAELPARPDVVLSAIIEAEGQILLVDDGNGGLTVPMARVGREGVHAALDALIASTGLKAEAGSIYAVYEDVAAGTQHIALRCPAERAEPAMGGFVELSRAGVSDVTDPALRRMLERLADESRIGNYGIYFGTHKQGRIQRVEKETGL